MVGNISMTQDNEEREEQTSERGKRKRTAMSPKDLKASMRKFAETNVTSPGRRSPPNFNNRRSSSNNSNSRIVQGGTNTGASKTPALFTKDLSGLPQLRTGADAVAYFAKFGDTTPLKFVHLNRAETGNDFRPYDLVVVSPADVHEEHFVFSSKGVMYFTSKRSQDTIKKADRKEKPTSITSLSRWVYEKAVFNMLTNYKTFKNYLIWKMFNNWKQAVKFRLFCKVRRKVEKKLFILKKIFQETILSVLKKSAIFRSNPLLNLEQKKTLSLDQFEALQTTRLHDVTEELDKMCQESFAEASDVSGHIKDELKMLRKRLAEPSIKKSMADERIEREGLLSAIEGLMKDKIRMIRFLKLIDRILIETMYVHGMETYSLF